MTLDTARAREHLAKGDLRALFIEELGWDRYTVALKVTVDDSALELTALAQKRGMVAYECPTPMGQPPPDYRHRRKIEQQVAKSAHEHLIVFTYAGKQTQVWPWVKRELGRPTACREHTFHQSQPGDALLQKLNAIAFTLEEEDQITLPDVARRARAGFDVERVTKRFYERFQKEHAVFLKFIAGITESTDREWYASVMLNRLMFVYFIQRKGFLDGDTEYLRNRLKHMQAEHGKNKFYSFYRYFLLRLFHEGLGSKARTPELEQLVGRIPYLNGGLFDAHELEKADRYGETIQIPDQAFERIFNYFDQYQWHLDERPLRADNEINPDVLGYIFEKYINQKEMGAYYTKEDITEYISANTLLPLLLDTARVKCKVAFENLKGPTVWDLLRDNPDRYIYPAVRHGAAEALPPDIAGGLHPLTLQKAVADGPVRTLGSRKSWNKPAPATHALPTETWRELIVRRRRHDEIKAKLANGKVRDTNDLVTLNLDIHQFAQDVIEGCEGPDLLRAFWQAIEKVTILDPTCGSGAFLFAALNVLEPLYAACLDRMEAFVEDLARSGEKHRPEKYSDFRRVLDRVAAHPNRPYFIFKSIILNNLFGVDIMPEAVEICKLRLFLKLAAQVVPDAELENLGIEPLPDIDFNIRAGNTLVGYATRHAIDRALGSKFDFENAAEKIAIKAADLQQAFDAFRLRQVEGDGSVPAEHKQELRRRLAALDDELNRHLAGDYGVDTSKKGALSNWLKSHQPFHWYVQFFGIMNAGGFDVIIGNPPYVEFSRSGVPYHPQNMATADCDNLWAFVLERSVELTRQRGRMSLITPLSLVSAIRFAPAYKMLNSTSTFASFLTLSGDAHPSVLFAGVKMSFTIFTYCKAAAERPRQGTVFSKLYRWLAAERSNLFDLIEYQPAVLSSSIGIPFKVGSACAAGVVTKLSAKQQTIAHVSSKTGVPLFYHRIARHFMKAFLDAPFFRNERDGERKSDDYKLIAFQGEPLAKLIRSFLVSSSYYFYYIALSDAYHCGRDLVLAFPVGADTLGPEAASDLRAAGTRYDKDLRKHSVRRRIRYKATGWIEYDEFYPRESKGILDGIDTLLAQHYGFTEDELDFVINYDIKYRMGADPEGEGG